MFKTGSEEAGKVGAGGTAIEAKLDKILKITAAGRADIGDNGENLLAIGSVGFEKLERVREAVGTATDPEKAGANRACV